MVVLWAGSLWTVGYLVAPTLFLTLPDSVLAGTIAGRMFRVEAWLSLLTALLLVSLYRVRGIEAGRSRRARDLILAMVCCTVFGYFCLQPFMAALRSAAPGGVLSGSSRVQFGVLHGLASALYLVESVLGAFLVRNHFKLLDEPVAGK